MTKLTCATDCGNSPKMQFIKDFNIAFAENDSGWIKSVVTDDIYWEMVGDKIIHGKSQFDNEIDTIADYRLKELHIEKILSHGRSAASSGIIVGMDDNRYKFCDVYEFQSTKGKLIKSIQSFVIQIS
ncbi:nuclear transport factor 2 family protein [Marinoscillum sp. MHG1-6]|uniref:nuclear transport factor 2 family protein n=1 Tax=Marinoscillum sp. MHG1-6 TaxID=2959627 RepID=UPI0021573D2B|nr:nuclear transport factor 2 family protein [Marinoscillum sp. MHG1-6]